VRIILISVLFALIFVRTDLEVDQMVETTYRTDSGPMGIGHPPLPYNW
jgi:hypothetical protein